MKCPDCNGLGYIKSCITCSRFIFTPSHERYHSCRLNGGQIFYASTYKCKDWIKSKAKDFSHCKTCNGTGNVEMDKSDILKFITSLRDSDKYIKTIYMKGGCYQFYLVLSSLYPDAEPFITPTDDHIVTKIRSTYYDINGVYDKPVKDIRLDMVDEIKTWSFSRTMMLSLGECSFCEEPILVNLEGEQIERKN